MLYRPAGLMNVLINLSDHSKGEESVLQQLDYN